MLLGKTANVNMYDAMFAAGLRLLLTELHHQLANYLGLSISQIFPNARRIFSGAEVIWGQLSGATVILPSTISSTITSLRKSPRQRAFITS